MSLIDVLREVQDDLAEAKKMKDAAQESGGLPLTGTDLQTFIDYIDAGADGATDALAYSYFDGITPVVVPAGTSTMTDHISWCADVCYASVESNQKQLEANWLHTIVEGAAAAKLEVQ